jgi:hypothetical protein
MLISDLNELFLKNALERVRSKELFFFRGQEDLLKKSVFPDYYTSVFFLNICLLLEGTFLFFYTRIQSQLAKAENKNKNYEVFHSSISNPFTKMQFKKSLHPVPNHMYISSYI